MYDGLIVLAHIQFIEKFIQRIAVSKIPHYQNNCTIKA